MTDHDSNNLHFLMSVSPETLADWWQQVDHDDRVYAFDLLDRASMALTMSTDSVTDVSQAADILMKFTLQ
jgi:predicted SAM-dependent methyltransferase